MSKQDDGGYAFPHMAKFIEKRGDAIVASDITQGGMSLRDYFAAAALQGMLANHKWLEFLKTQEGGNDASGSAGAYIAYVHADAMLKERAK
jgi:hypothetical protein